MIHVEVRSASGTTLASAKGNREARLIYDRPYRPGDCIHVKADTEHLHMAVDQAVEPSLVFLPKKTFIFVIPFGEAKNGYAPCAFEGQTHAIWIRHAAPHQIHARRNVAHNPLDQRHDSFCFPHAVANVETRGEAQFWARNTIDGVRFNDKHGSWPYHSWGIGERADAWLRIDFGRSVRIDEVALTLRADFPHDAWWERCSLHCSDGFSRHLMLLKTAESQFFSIGEHAVTWVRLSDLQKAEDPSPFPALTQLEVFGQENA